MDSCVGCVMFRNRSAYFFVLSKIAKAIIIIIIIIIGIFSGITTIGCRISKESSDVVVDSKE